MLPEDIKKKIKYIQIRTKKVLNGSFIGNNNSVIKGTGIEFDQIREYQDGDDVRFIHWSSSAKTGKLLIKQYFEERNRNIIIAIDVSASSYFYSKNLKKYDLISQIGCILTLVAQHSKDNVGLLIFSDKVHEFIFPNQSNIHFSNLINKIFEQKNNSSQTNINIAFEYLIKNAKKDSIIFFISDFINDQSYEENLKILSKKVCLVPIKCSDKNEIKLPKIGLINVKDFESGKEIILDLNKNNLQKINNAIYESSNEENKLFTKCGIKMLRINSDQDFFTDLIYYFKYLEIQ